MRIAVAVAVALALAGCFENSSTYEARTVCTAYCECFKPTGQRELCVEDCVPGLPPVSDPCLECVYANSQLCTNLAAECTDICLDTGTPLLGGM